MRFEPVDALFVGLFRRGQLVGFDFIMQHELQRGAGDLVIVDHKNAPLVDRLRCFDSDLHFILLWLAARPTGRPMGLPAIFVPPTWLQHYPENIDGSGGAIAPNG